MREPEPAPDIHHVKVKIISPEKVVLIAEVDKVLLPCFNGDLMILPRHAPCFCSIRAGKLLLYDKGKIISAIVSDGVAEIRRNICVVLAWGILSDNIKRPDVEAQLTATEKLLKTIHTSDKQMEVLARVRFLNLLKAELDNRGE